MLEFPDIVNKILVLVYHNPKNLFILSKEVVASSGDGPRGSVVVRSLRLPFPYPRRIPSLTPTHP